MINAKCWFLQIDYFTENFPHRHNVLFLSSQFYVIHTHDGERTSNPNWKPSPNRAAIGFSQIAFLITVLPKDDHTDSVQKEQLGLRYWTMIQAICVVVDESKCLDTPISTWVLADTASAACPSQPSNLEMISMTFAAVI